MPPRCHYVDILPLIEAEAVLVYINIILHNVYYNSYLNLYFYGILFILLYCSPYYVNLLLLKLGRVLKTTVRHRRTLGRQKTVTII